MYDFTKSYLPFATVLSLLFFVAWATQVVVRSHVEIDHEFQTLKSVVDDLAHSTKGVVEILVVRSAERWTYADMVDWCEKQKLKYVDLECPKAPTQREIERKVFPNGTGSAVDQLERIQEKMKKLQKGASSVNPK